MSVDLKNVMLQMDVLFRPRIISPVIKVSAAGVATGPLLAETHHSGQPISGIKGKLSCIKGGIVEEGVRSVAGWSTERGRVEYGAWQGGVRRVSGWSQECGRVGYHQPE